VESLADESRDVDSSQEVGKPRFSAPCRANNASALRPLAKTMHGEVWVPKHDRDGQFSGRVLRLPPSQRLEINPPVNMHVC